MVKLKLHKIFTQILSKMVYEDLKRWADFLHLVLRAYRTLKCPATQATPFSLVYVVEAMVPIEVVVP